LNKYLKWTLRSLGSFFALLLILLLVLKIYVGSNKTRLIAEATEKISEKIGGKIEIKDVGVSMFKNFPYLTISLQELKITDSLYAKHQHALVQAEAIYLRVNPLKLLILNVSLNRLRIEKGGFYIYKDSTGYCNEYLLKGNGKKKETKPNNQFNNILDNIVIRDFNVTINDQKELKLFDFQINEFLVKNKQVDSILYLQTKSNILVKSFSFKTTKGSFVENQLFEGNWDLKFNTKTPALLFDSMTINISKQPFVFKGGFHFGTQQSFDLDITTKQIKLDFAKKLLTKKIAKSVGLADVGAPLDVHTIIRGSLVGGGDPYIKAAFETKNAALKTPVMSFDSASFNGYYLNEVVAGQERTDENSTVVVQNLDAKYLGLPVHSDDILIINLTTPHISADLQSKFSLYGLDEFLQTDAFTLSNGEGVLDFMYEGPIEKITQKNASIKGLISLKNGTITLSGSNAALTNCATVLKIDNTDIYLDTLTCSVAGHPITVSARAKNVVALVGDNPNGIEFDLKVSAPIININQLSSVVSRKFPVKKKNTRKHKGGLGTTIQRLEHLLSNGRMNIKVAAGKIKYKEFEANNLKAEMEVDDVSWRLKKTSLVHGKGNISVSASVRETRPNIFTLNSDIEMYNVEADRVWREFDNFGMSSPTYKNIKGLLSLKSNVTLNMKHTGEFDMNSLNGKASFSIKNGALINFEPLQNIKTFLFKNRDLSDVRFAEIKDDINFQKGLITINRMEINSSVLSLYVEGTHSKKETDISIQVPLSNLKNRDKDYKPENTGAGKSGGMSVFLRAKTDETGKIKIKYDPFKRFRKSDKKEAEKPKKS